MISMACALTGTRNEQVALTDVQLRATLCDLLCEVSATQVYRNDEQVAIEAVYTFPLPLDAVLLDLEVTLGSRRLHGVVVEKASAEAQYERAIDRGDSAVMLQQLEPGLWTMNVGNLLPGESARITTRYALLHRWDGDRLRLLFPTTVAPRYGASPHAPHQVPEHSLTVENHFSFELEVVGALREAQFSSPSHTIGLQRGREATRLSLREVRAVMDRDLIVQLRAPQAARGCALGGADSDGMAVVASFQPFFPGLRQPQPLALAIVVDCSGSMQGDSMVLARRALHDAVGVLTPDDRVGVIAFGNESRAMTPALIACTPEGIARTNSFVGALDATMGGTEIGGALQHAYRLLREERRGDIFLITDGEVSGWQEVVADARRRGHRVFTVGVGSAVTEAFVRELAQATGGASELVAPREGMLERIVRHFERMRAPRARAVKVTWPDGARDVTPSRVDAVYEGDTVIATARLGASATGMVVLEVETEDGEVGRTELAIPALAGDATAGAGSADSADSAAQSVVAARPSTVARIAAALRLPALDERAAAALAVQYQLASPYSHWLVIAERAEGEKSTTMPELRKVPQTLAAGWGGVGTAAQMRMPAAAPVSFSRYASQPMEALGELDAGAPLMAELRVSDRRAPSDGLFERRAMDGAERENGSWDLLVMLANDAPTRISEDGAAHLLEEAGFENELHALIDLARQAGVTPQVVPALLLVRELSGARRRQLSPAATRALDRLRQSTEPARDELQRLGSGGDALLHGLRRQLGSALLEPSAWEQLSEHFAHRMDRLRQMVQRLLG